MAPEKLPRSSTEVASRLRRVNGHGDDWPAERVRREIESLCHEAAEHIEALVVAISESSKVFGMVAKGFPVYDPRKGIAPDPITGQGYSRTLETKLAPGFDGRFEAGDVATFTLKGDRTVEISKARSTERLVETLRAVDVEGEAAA